MQKKIFFMLPAAIAVKRIKSESVAVGKKVVFFFEVNLSEKLITLTVSQFVKDFLEHLPDFVPMLLNIN